MESNQMKKNTYLDQVVAQQSQLEDDLRGSRARRAPREESASAPPLPAAGIARRVGNEPVASNAVEVRVTGFGRWKTVVVPPNAYVVHTRRGRAEPLHLGLGVSFKFNPYFDSYLAVPGAMQTILINAHSICRELQGLLVQGYVQ